MNHYITKKYLIIPLVMASFISLLSFIEKLNVTVFHMTDIDLGLIMEVEFTFVQTFVTLLPIIFVNSIVSNKNKYIINFIILITFSTYLFVTIPNSPYTIVQIIMGALIHSSATAIVLILNYYLYKKYNIEFLYYIFAFFIFTFSITLSYLQGLKSDKTYNTQKTEAAINMHIGSYIERLYTYNELHNLLTNNKKDPLSAVEKHQNKTLQTDIDTIVSHPLIFNLLKTHGYCEEWKRLQDKNINNLNNTHIINEKCKEE